MHRWYKQKYTFIKPRGDTSFVSDATAVLCFLWRLLRKQEQIKIMVRSADVGAVEKNNVLSSSDYDSYDSQSEPEDEGAD